MQCIVVYQKLVAQAFLIVVSKWHTFDQCYVKDICSSQLFL